MATVFTAHTFSLSQINISVVCVCIQGKGFDVITSHPTPPSSCIVALSPDKHGGTGSSQGSSAASAQFGDLVIVVIFHH